MRLQWLVPILLLRSMTFADDDREGYTKNIADSEILGEYDFVVVGAGSGGSAIASRLSEVPQWKILLLEAGGEETALTDIPMFTNDCKQRAAHSYPEFSSEPDPNSCLCMKDNKCPFTIGKGMGGSSVVDFMMYMRGNKFDFNVWEYKLKNEGWSWSDVIQYYIKSEKANGDFASSIYHGTNGLLNVEHPSYFTPLVDVFLKAGEELGYNKLVDYNTGTPLGFSKIQAFSRKGVRCSASKAFLRPVKNRPNLHIAKGVYVQKLLFTKYNHSSESSKSSSSSDNSDSSNSDNCHEKQIKLKVKSIKFGRGDTQFSVKVKKEVILTASSLCSPQILMLSGIGPKNHLESLGIPVLHDLPGVGENLRDQVGMSGLTYLINDTVSLLESRIYKNNKNLINFFNNKKGPLTSISGIEAVGYIRTKLAKIPKPYPDIALIFQASNGQVFRNREEMLTECKNIYEPLNEKDSFTIIPVLLRPRSKGYLRLKDTDPNSYPLIYNNYFSEPIDLFTLVEGMKIVQQLSQTNAFKAFDSKLFNTPIPACSRYPFSSDDYMQCAAKHMTFSFFNHFGTCKMGCKSDAVVDRYLKVHGVKGLRIADSSIMPAPIGVASTSATAFMIAEKCADMIKEYYLHDYKIIRNARHGVEHDDGIKDEDMVNFEEWA